MNHLIQGLHTIYVDLKSSFFDLFAVTKTFEIEKFLSDVVSSIMSSLIFWPSTCRFQMQRVLILCKHNTKQ